MAIFQSLGGNPQPSQQQTPKAPSTTRKILRYSMMPEILPRIRGLGLHFGHFAYLLALVFASARLIPQSHPVMNAANIGRFGVRQVIAIAANNLTWDRKHIDQIGIFSAIIIGIIMLVIQAGLIAIYALMGGEASAQAADPSSFFMVPDETKDLSMMAFSQIFGDLGGLWGNTNAPGSKTDIHNAIYAMLKLYSQAMMVIAVIIVLYYILTVIGEAAKTGTPFGQRFNSLWAPIRLVVALGLLVPLGSGLNSAQYITLWTAKMGAGLGGQAWSIMATELIKDRTQYIVDDSNASWVYGLTRNIFLAETCAQLFNKHNRGSDAITMTPSFDPGSALQKQMSYTLSWVSENSNLDGRCGSVSLNMRIPEREEKDDRTTAVYLVDDTVVPAEQLFNASRAAVDAIYAAVQPIAETYAKAKIAPVEGTDNLDSIQNSLNSISRTQQQNLETAIETAYANRLTDQFNSILSENISRGWLSAGIWTIKLGQIIAQADNPKQEMIPSSSAVADKKDSNLGRRSVWEWVTGAQDEVYDAYNAVYYRLNNSAPSDAIANEDTDNSIDADEYDLAEDGLGYTDEHWLVGVRVFILTMIVPESLVRLRSEPTLDPMASLITAGNEIFMKAFIFVGAASAALIAKEINFKALISKIPLPGARVTGFIVGGALNLIASTIALVAPLMILLGTAGLAAGFILAFVLPLIPFIYFFFAAVSWFLEIIEAVIAMPLWALAHLRIDGDGMPGQAAINGYHLLLAILLRPAIIVVALAFGYVAFGASIFLLQHLFDPLIGVVNNEAQYGVSLLIYTVIYAFLCYSLAMVCFKMVDSVPNNILRWLGSGAQTFADQNPNDPVNASTGAVVAGATLATTAVQSAPGAMTGIGKLISGQNRQQDEVAGMSAANTRAEYERNQAGGNQETPPPPQEPRRGFGDGDTQSGFRGRYDNADDYTGGDNIDGDPPEER